MKKLLSLLLVLLLLSALPAAVLAEDSDFVIDAQGVLTAYTGPGGLVVIPDGVTKIADVVFRGKASVTGIVIPDSVTEIGHFAFQETGLTELSIPGSVREPGQGICSGCAALQKVTLGEGVESLQGQAFWDCTALTQIVFPSTLKQIYEAFNGCTALTTLTVPGTVTTVGDGAFRNCTGLKTLTICEGVQEIGYNAFRGCAGLTSLSLPDSLVRICDGAFAGCEALGHVDVPAGLDTLTNYYDLACAFPGRQLDGKYYDFIYDSDGTLTGYRGHGGDVVIPDGTVSIKSNVFENKTAVTSVTFPAGITQIGSFSGCTGLSSLTVPAGVTSLGTCYGCTALKSVSLPEGVTQLGSFAGCTALESITIPGSLKSIRDNAFSGCTSLRSVTLCEGVEAIGYAAFKDCESLTELHLPESLTRITNEAFYGCPLLRSVRVPLSVDRKNDALAKAFPEGALSSVSADFETEGTVLKRYTGPGGDVVIPDGITEIDSHAFDGISLTSVTIPAGVTKISGFNVQTSLVRIALPDCMTTLPDHCFSGCTALKSVTLPTGLTAIPDYCFAGCEALTEITIPDGVTEIGFGAFAKCTALTQIRLPAGLKTLKGSANTMDGGVFDGCTALKSIDIPGVTKIGDMSFYNCTALETVTLGEGVEEIGLLAFEGCKNLTAVSLPGTLRTIRSRAFSGCTALTAISIPDGVTEIATNAFSGSGITEVPVPGAAANNEKYFQIDEASVLTAYTGPGGDVVIPEGVKAIGDSAFAGKKDLTSVVTPATVTKIGAGAFAGCVRLSSAPIPAAVTEIGDGAFANCAALTQVALPASLRVLGVNAFAGAGMKELTIPGGVKELPETFMAGDRTFEKITLLPGTEVIGKKAFAACTALKEIVLPAGLRRIEAEAFYGCTALEALTIPDTVEFIGDDVFQSTALKTITFPDSVVEVGSWPFKNCDELRSIYLPKDNGLYKGMGFKRFAICVRYVKHLDVIDESPSPTLRDHIKYSVGIREAWKNMSCPTQTERVQALSDRICNGLTSEYDKLKAISEWVCKNLEYDVDYYDYGLKTYAEVPFTPEEILDSGLAVCAGYSRLTQALCNAQGIPCLYVLGSTTGGYHAWNLAYADGRFVWLDNTWGMDYFDLGEAVISIDHWATGGTVFTDPNDRTAGRVSFTRTQADVSVADLMRNAEEDQKTLGDAIDGTTPDPAPDPAREAIAFSDVAAGAYYAAAVDWAVEKGVTNGTKLNDENGKNWFSPEAAVKRGDAMTFLWRAGGCPAPETQLSNPFRDVEAGKYYEKAILWAIENNITNGTKWDEANGVYEFSPNAPVKRNEMLTFLWRAMGEPGKTGDDEGKKWYSDAEAWAEETGLLAGLPTAYSGNEPCPRSDVVYYLFRVLAADETEAAPLDLSAAAVYARILAKRSEYPEGMRWTNADSYTAKARLNGATYIGYGCAGFALILSDAAFGEAPIRQLNAGEFTYADLRVGDILRVNGNSHSVVVLEVSDSAITVAEGNYNSSVHWGRKLPRPTAEAADYVLTRYPA